MITKKFAKVFFDVDSTLVTIEGIDELGAGDARIRELTSAAMDGRISIAEVYGLRLDAIRPTRLQVAGLAELYLSSLTPGAAELVRDLVAAGSDVHLVTAAIEQAVLPLASSLGITARAVHAVPLIFSPDGSYSDYDRRSYLWRPGGKELVIRDVRARSKGRAALIGDGMSDAEARGAVDLFIGFGGVVHRPAVEALASVFITGRDLALLRPHLLEVSP